MKSITKQSIMKMMEEEMQNYTSNRSITKNKIRKMMEEELANMKENEEGLSNLKEEVRPFGERTYERSLVSNVSKTIEWDIDQAFNFVLDLLEDVNAHPEYKAVMKLLSGGLSEEVRPFGDRTYDRSLVSNVSKTIEWDIDQAFNFVLDLLEDVNAHAEYKAVMRLLSRGLSEARKRPLKRHRDAFDRNTQMVSDLQKTISSFLKEGGAKLNKNHTAIIEKISTRLMHLANSPMIKLSEGDANSRMISSLERIGDDVKRIKHMSVDPAVLDVTDKLLEDIQQLWQDMMGVQ